jgi:hypothetical protein
MIVKTPEIQRAIGRPHVAKSYPDELRVGDGRVAVVQIDHDSVPTHTIEHAVGDQGVLRAPATTSKLSGKI